MFEKQWSAVAPQAFIADGGQFGLVTVTDTAGFKVKAQVVISASTLPNLTLQCKRVLSKTQLVVGPLSGSIGSKTDLSAYTVALTSFIYQDAQDKNTISPQDIVQAVYDQEPGCRLRIALIDKYGNDFDSGNPLSVLAQGAAADQPWDEMDIGRDPTTQDVKSVTYKMGGVAVRTLTMSYDANGNLSGVVKS